MTTKELKVLIKVLRANGVVSYKHNGFELLLDPAFKAVEPKAPEHVPGQLASELNKAAPGHLGLTAEQVLFYSSEGQ